MRGFFNLFRFNQPVPSSIWKKYKQENQKQLPKSTPIDELEFAVIDTETTGLDTKRDEIISIAGIIVKKNEIFINTGFEYLIKTPKNTKNSIPIHGILPGRTAAGNEEKEVMEAFLNFLGNKILVAHHAGFDIAMINKALKKHFKGKILNSVIDTEQLAYRLDHLTNQQPIINHQEYSLDQLCTSFNISIIDRHTASGDVFLTAQLLLKLLSKAKKKGINTLGRLFRKYY